MSNRAGSYAVKLRDGSVRRNLTKAQHDALIEKVAGTESLVRRPSLMSAVSGLANRESYSTPGRARELLSEAGGATYNLASEAMPMIAGTAATLPFGGVGGLTGASLRTLAGAAGMYGGSMAGDVMQGQAPDFNQAAQNFGAGVVLGPVGEALGFAGNKLALNRTEQAFHPNSKMIEKSPTITEDLLKARVKLRGRGEPSVEARKLKAKSMAATRRMVARSPGSISVDDALASVTAARNSIARSAPTDARLPQIDQFIADFRAKWGNGRVSVQQAHEMKLQAQKEASSRFARENNSPETLQEMNKHVAQDVRVALGREMPRTATSRGYNAQDRMTQRAKAMEKVAEKAPTVRREGLWQGHAMMGGAGAIGGMAVGHDIPSAIVGGVAAPAAVAAWQNPIVANRLALFLDSPIVRQILMNGPKALAPVVSPMMPGGKKE